MDRPSPEILARMPLAEAVLLLWRWVADADHLQSLFERFRGRCYERRISFPLMVQLICDALLRYEGSARRSFERSEEQGELAASLRAAYGKLSRMPIPLSMGFFAESSDRLRALYPDHAMATLPKSLNAFQVVVLDGKAIKRVAKRLKSLRGIPGGLLGGRALVALDMTKALVVAMHVHPDGDAHEVRFVPELLPEVRRRLPGPRLWVADRAFGDLANIARFNEEGDHYVLRYHPKSPLIPDAERLAQEGKDDQGRGYVEQWGWLGSLANRQRRYVRWITLHRPGEEDIILMTDLLDAHEHPATDLLNLYLERWGVERVFQQVTEVFGLTSLIGSTPEATIFQFAFCLLLYNMIQVAGAFIAVAQPRPRETISTEKLFQDVTQELMAWNVMMDVGVTVAYFDRPWTVLAVRRRLERLLHSVWSDRWIKSPPQKRRLTPKAATARTHNSVYRILQNYRRKITHKR